MVSAGVNIDHSDPLKLPRRSSKRKRSSITSTSNSDATDIDGVKPLNFFNGISHSVPAQGSLFSKASAPSAPYSPNKTKLTGDDLLTASSETMTCKWRGCRKSFPCTSFLEHMEQCHIAIQRSSYACLWLDCKVFNKPAKNSAWLRLHVTKHSVDKPFKCAFAGCLLKFRTASGLQRHYDSHFNQEKKFFKVSRPKVKDGRPSKALLKRWNAKRRRAAPVIRPDGLDKRTLQAMERKLVSLACHFEMDPFTNSADEVSFYFEIHGRCTDEKGNNLLLLHWFPENLFPDQWLDESEALSLEPVQLPIARLSHAHLCDIYRLLNHSCSPERNDKMDQHYPEAK